MVWGEHAHTHPAETVVTFAVPSWGFRALITDGGCLWDYLNIMISATYMHTHTPDTLHSQCCRTLDCALILCATNKLDILLITVWFAILNLLPKDHTHILKCKEVIISKNTLSPFLSHKCTSGFWVYSHLLGMDLFQWPGQTHSRERSTIRPRDRWTKTEAGRWETPRIRY